MPEGRTGETVTFALTDPQIDRWSVLLEDANADATWVARCRKYESSRPRVQQEIVAFVGDYLAGNVATEDLKATLDRKTRTEWEGFGLKGMGGAMFLNMLVKYLPDTKALAKQLKAVLRAPSDTPTAKAQMRDFYRFLNGVIGSGEVQKRQVQPARTPFFVSSIWHLQDVERWPPFYISARNALSREGIYVSKRDPVEDYFNFRGCFMALQTALELKSWTLERLLAWHDRQSSPPPPPPPPPTASTSMADEVETEALEDEEGHARCDEAAVMFSHTHMQWLLAKIGRKLGCRVWVAANDRKKEWEGERLGDLSLDSLPDFGMDRQSQRLVSLIDVVWLRGAREVAAAFEIEHTTSIFSGLLRLSDLASLSPNLNFPLYVVAPENRLGEVARQLGRPTFQALELHHRCGFFSDIDLLRESEGIMRWANDVSAIDKLARRVDDDEESTS